MRRQGGIMANWIWYPGDFEIYHGMKQNYDREERGFFWPAYWHMSDWRHHLRFRAVFCLERQEVIRVAAKGRGYVNVKYRQTPPPWMKQDEEYWSETKYPIGKDIVCQPGDMMVEAVVGNMEGLPCICVTGDTIVSDGTWLVWDFASEEVSAGWNGMYVRPEQNPMEFEYTSQVLQPKEVGEVNGGLLFDFGREVTAETVITFPEDVRDVTLCYGESRQEALDTEFCYLKQELKAGQPGPDGGEMEELFGRFETEGTYHTRLRAFRYIFVPGTEAASGLQLRADHKFVDFPRRSSFTCGDERINKIWEVSEETFRLASGIFFLDGIKRDRWIWSGDAYQSYFINRYVSFDKEICKRTILALKGNDPVVQHINTILDYSMYWVISLEDYFEMTGDDAFLKMIYPKMESMMNYLMEQLDENGFIYGRPGDWVYIDWADLDKEGTLCAEQMLLARSYQAAARVREILGIDGQEYLERFQKLKKNICTYFWDEEKGAYIDSYVSGRRHVTRHANIFAVLFGYTDDDETESIVKNVLLNDEVDAITTPYFKFYELEVLASLGYFDRVMETMKDYWGGMLDRGADTFWEEFKPDQPEEEQYSMYGDKYGKSLCHAWGASPIYLIGRYFMGVRPVTPAYASFEVKPQLGQFERFECTFPVGEGSVWMRYENGILKVKADRPGGVLKAGQDSYELETDKELVIVEERGSDQR